MNLKMPAILLRRVKNNCEQTIYLQCKDDEWSLEPSQEEVLNIPMVPCSSADQYHENKLSVRIGDNMQNLWFQDDKLKRNDSDEYDPDAPEIEIPDYQPGDNIKLICTDVDILGEVDDE